jgi:hypothetical protein
MSAPKNPQIWSALPIQEIKTMVAPIYWRRHVISANTGIGSGEGEALQQNLQHFSYSSGHRLLIVASGNGNRFFYTKFTPIAIASRPTLFFVPIYL